MTRPENKRLKTLDNACATSVQRCVGYATTDTDGYATLSAGFDSRGQAGIYKVGAVSVSVLRCMSLVWEYTTPSVVDRFPLAPGL